MKLYKPSKDYLEYICALDEHLLYSNTIIGIDIRMNEQIYLIPIDSIGESDFNNQGDVRKSTTSIMRMIDLVSHNCIGKCLLSNMFPIPYKEIEVYDLKSNDDETFVLFEKKIEYVRKNLNRIIQAAKRIYNQKTKAYK